MPDRAKIIERLKKISHYFKSLRAVGWQGDADIYREYMESVNMAINLLREQEPVAPIKGRFVCGNCYEDIYVGYNYCPHCRMKVKWDD